MIFETLAYLDGTIRHWRYHYMRYLRGCNHFKLDPHPEARLRKALEQAVSSKNGVLRFEQTPESLNITTRSWPDYPNSYYEQGVHVAFADGNLQPFQAPALIKCSERHQYQSAMDALTSSNFQELLLTDTQHNVIEGTKTNIFAVINQTLVTPDLSDVGVAGTMREAILDYVHHHNILCEVRSIARNELLDAQHIYLTNAIIGIWPVAKLAHKAFTPGPLYRQLFDGLNLSHGKA